MDSHRPGDTLIFDNFDVDLLVKVLENTAFSASPSFFNGIIELTKLLGPFFLFFIPIFYFFHGAKISDPSIVLSSIYFISATIFCKLSAIMTGYRGNTQLRVCEMVFKTVSKPR